MTIEQAVNFLATQGVLGVVCIVLLFALREVFKLYVAAQNRLTEESVNNRTAYERNTAALSALTEVIKERKG